MRGRQAPRTRTVFRWVLHRGHARRPHQPCRTEGGGIGPGWGAACLQRQGRDRGHREAGGGRIEALLCPPAARQQPREGVALQGGAETRDPLERQASRRPCWAPVPTLPHRDPLWFPREANIRPHPPPPGPVQMQSDAADSRCARAWHLPVFRLAGPRTSEPTPHSWGRR